MDGILGVDIFIFSIVGSLYSNAFSRFPFCMFVPLILHDIFITTPSLAWNTNTPPWPPITCYLPENHSKVDILFVIWQLYTGVTVCLHICKSRRYLKKAGIGSNSKDAVISGDCRLLPSELLFTPTISVLLLVEIPWYDRPMWHHQNWYRFTRDNHDS